MLYSAPPCLYLEFRFLRITPLSAIFNMKKKVTLKGTVTKVDWVNPHIVMFMDVKEEDGNVVNWKFESNPPRWFTKVGVTRANSRPLLARRSRSK